MSDQPTYQPDPAAEILAVIDAFFAALSDAFPSLTDLTPRLRSRHERLLTEQQHRVIDEPSQHNLALTLAVLAAYRELTPSVSDADLLPILRKAFVEPSRPYVQAATKSTLDESPDPFTTMVDISRQRELHAFGAGFTFTHPHDTPDHYVAQVDRCYYHDVLHANNAVHLTPIFCAFDANWIDAINPTHHHFTFTRPTTIGTGGPNCPFRFRRTRS